MNYLGKIHGVFFVVLGFLAGVTLSFSVEISLVYILLVILILCAVLIPIHLKVLLFGIFLLLGFVRAEWWQSQYGFATLIPGEYQLIGYVSAEPDVREFSTRLTVTLEGSHERALITLPHYPEYLYGDYVYINGELLIPEAFETDTGRVFDYHNFLKKEKIYYVVRYPEVSLITSGTHGNAVTKNLLHFKRGLLYQIERILPEPHSSLLGGLLVGAKSSMGDELLDQFRKTGVIHIVVLSGFNVTIIAEAIMRTLAFLGVVGSAVFGSLAILLFTIMTGASATVVRASLMAFLVILARVTGYQSEIIRALCIAAFVMVLHNPMILLYDPSFQLSFLATLGLIVLVPWIDEKITILPKTVFDLRGLAAASIGTQLFVLPLLVWMTGEVSLVSPLVNILVLWVVPVTMLIGFVALVISVFSVTIAIPVSLAAWFLLGYILQIVEWFATFPLAITKLPALSVLAVVLIYLLYLLIYVISDSTSHAKEPQ